MKEDKRITRSKNALKEALIDLTLEKGYEQVTIRDVTEQADVGYATFFRHFADKDELLHLVLQSFSADLRHLIDTKDTLNNARTHGTLIFRYVAQKSYLFRVMLSSSNSSAILKEVRNDGIQAVLTEFTPNPDSPVPPEIAAHHLVSSIISLTRWWLEHDMPYPPQKMGEVYAELILRPTHSMAFLS